jgi:glycosyltransferase involved in cell wall biosynthesis
MEAHRGPAICVQLLPDTDDAGAENQARYLIAGLRDIPDLAPQLAYFAPGRLHAGFEALDVPSYHVPRRGRLWRDFVGRARRLRRAFGGTPPDILHTWLLEANIVGLIAARSWPRTRVVISQRGSWNELDYPWHLRLQRRLLARADHAISNSPGGAEMLAREGLATDRISVVQNGVPMERVRVDADRARLRADRGWEDAKVVAWVGRLDDGETAGHKDFGNLLGAVKRLRTDAPNAILVLVGPTVEEVRARGFELPPWAQALGWQRRPAETLLAADVLALSSRFEGSSNVVAEALMLGIPVVSTDCGGHVSAVRETGGRVVPIEDPSALAAGLQDLLCRPPDPGRVRARAMELFGVDVMVSRTASIYRNLLAA